MVLIGAGITAVGAAFLINRVAVRFLGPQGIVFLVPVIEEGAKTGGAYLWQAGLLETHLFFGLMEACYDLWQGGKGMGAPLLSLAGHGLFGFATYVGVHFTGSLPGGLVVGIVLHSIWNGAIIGLCGKAPGN